MGIFVVLWWIIYWLLIFGMRKVATSRRAKRWVLGIGTVFFFWPMIGHYLITPSACFILGAGPRVYQEVELRSIYSSEPDLYLAGYSIWPPAEVELMLQNDIDFLEYRVEIGSTGWRENARLVHEPHLYQFWVGEYKSQECQNFEEWMVRVGKIPDERSWSIPMRKDHEEKLNEINLAYTKQGCLAWKKIYQPTAEYELFGPADGDIKKYNLGLLQMKLPAAYIGIENRKTKELVMDRKVFQFSYFATHILPIALGSMEKYVKDNCGTTIPVSEFIPWYNDQSKRPTLLERISNTISANW